MVLPMRECLSHYPVEGCSGRLAMRTSMRVHFWNRYVRDTIVILEEGNLSYPLCPLCDILVPWWSMNGLHNGTAQCKKG